MGLELRQQLKLSQQLIMTPQLQQAIRLLQLSRLELVETVHQEMLENPFLEEGETQSESDSDEDMSVENQQPEEHQEEIVYDREIARTADWEDYLGDFASTPRLMQPREYEVPEEMTSLEARLSAPTTLSSHLMWQLRLSSLTETEKDMGEIIINNLASSGYLEASLEEMTKMAQDNILKLQKEYPEEESVALPHVADMEKVLKVVQLFDPVGVAARSPQECLMIQIKNYGYDRDPILVSLVQEHLEDLESHRYKPLLRKFHLEIDDLKEYINVIQSLDPMPGSSFGEGDPTYISPDAFVYKIDDDFVILLNDEDLPNLHISSVYTDMAEHASTKDKEYFTEKLRSATWLIKSLQQRQRTLYKVIESIVKHQKEFFEQGLTKLHPLILKDIAEDIDMHESTVSRITTNKYIATSYGVFELKFFFNSALAVDDGSQVGSESVRTIIKKCIAEEDPNHPLSDEKLVQILKDHLKINIARRTIAKYRINMNIPSSSQRKAHI